LQGAASILREPLRSMRRSKIGSPDHRGDSGVLKRHGWAMTRDGGMRPVSGIYFSEPDDLPQAPRISTRRPPIASDPHIPKNVSPKIFQYREGVR
jgi:hypothetical protein